MCRLSASFSRERKLRSTARRYSMRHRRLYSDCPPLIDKNRKRPGVFPHLCRLRFHDQACFFLGAARKLEELEHNSPVELGVEGSVDDPHSAFAQFLEDPVI